MTYEDAIKHLSDPTVISTIFNKKTREAVRAVVKKAKEDGLDTKYEPPYDVYPAKEDIRDCN